MKMHIATVTEYNMIGIPLYEMPTIGACAVVYMPYQDLFMEFVKYIHKICER